MSKESAPSRYHPVHVALHWLMFLLVVMMLGVGKFVMPGIPADSPQKPSMLQTHAYIGIFITLLLIVRIILYFTTQRPAPADAGNAFLNFVARAVHLLLYLLLIGMAVSGLGMFQQANLPAVFSGAAPYPADFFAYPPRMGHGLVSTLLVLLIVLHVGAALYHQFIRKDNLLSRMWFGKR
ncbi:MAG: cytochrome b/b6 domain-containing protein [Chloroflexi bacterium]|nr:cytochrome b/b6 domain-containing protein [Chloroflexota bacterium]